MSRSPSISRPSTRSRSRASQDLGAPSGGLAWLTHAALLIVLAVVVCRLLISEQLRNATAATDASPVGPGVTTTLLLDLLACIPAMLVLARRMFDRTFRLRAGWAAAPALLLGAWAVASSAWSADRFSALVGSITFCSAMALMWAAIQTIGSWFRFRIVAGVCIGLLVILTSAGYWFHFEEWPDLKSQWVQDRDQVLRAHDWKPNSFEANQFEKRIFAGELMGFSTSPNTHAALLVLLGTIVAGIAIQRRTDGDAMAWPIALLLLIVLALPTLRWTGCRAAVGTTLGAAVALTLRGYFGPFFSRHARRMFIAGVVVFCLGIALLVFRGLTRGTLWHDSLTFRWWYWVASVRMFAAHPLRGVGWDNFGAHYLAVRLPIASEEIRDPHNLIVRFATELGSVGLILLLAWMGRLWWDLTTRPAHQTTSDHATSSLSTTRALGIVFLISGAAIVLSGIAGIDFVTSSAYALLEVVRRFVFFLFLAGGVFAGSMQMRVVSESVGAKLDTELALSPDDRPAPWILYAMIAGLGFFLVHSLIDFAFFETGPMYLFALLSGAAIGMRQTESDSAKEGQEKRSLPATIALAGTGILWVVALFAVVIPIARSEQDLRDADVAAHDRRPGEAASAAIAAARRVPYNSDYALRAATILLGSHDAANRDAAVKLLDNAVNADPTSGNALITQSQLALMQTPPAIAAATADYAKAVRLDPNNFRLRLRFVDLLLLAGDRSRAREQIDAALRANDGLSPPDPKRLSAIEVQKYQAEADRLRSSP